MPALCFIAHATVRITRCNSARTNRPRHGGASGLGGAVVDMVVAAGGRAVILDLNDEKGRAKAAQLAGTGPFGPAAVRFVKADVTQRGRRAARGRHRGCESSASSMASSTPRAFRPPNGCCGREGRAAARALHARHPDQSDRHVQRDPPGGRGDGHATHPPRAASAASSSTRPRSRRSTGRSDRRPTRRPRAASSA